MKPLKIKDGSLIHGMNTVDDPRTLPEGQCVRMLNAFPGDPPVPRNGCPGRYKTHIDETDDFHPPVIIVRFENATVSYAIAWIYNENTGKYYISRIRVDASDEFYDFGYAEIDSPMFGIISVFSDVYCFSSVAMSSWNGESNALGNKVIEGAETIRDMSISVAAEVTSVASEVAAGGVFSAGNCFDYGFQYVRRTDSDAFEDGTNTDSVILPAGFSGKIPKTMTTFLPGVCIGVELTANREVVTVAADTSSIVIDYSNDMSQAIKQGATHLRVCRSLVQTSEENAQGATKFWLVDLALGNGVSEYTDNTSDAAMQLEENQLVVGYSAAPPAAYGRYHRGRMFLVGSDGMVYYSESVGGGGYIASDMAQTNPQAFASMFNPLTYILDCDHNDGIDATGVEVLDNDIYFFKESKIFVLYGGDPTATSLSSISQTVGSPFPHTIRKMEVSGISEIIFFMSNRGPAYIGVGGKLEFFSAFKIKEIWPDEDRELFGQLEDYKESIIRQCTSAYIKNTIWIFYKTAFGAKKIFGYYFSPTDSGTQGPLEVSLAIVDIYGAIVAIDEKTLKAYMFGKGLTKLVITQFLKDSFYEDIGTEDDESEIVITEAPTGIVDSDPVDAQEGL